MTQPTYRVVVYFDFPFAGTFFTLDDPVRGLLDDPTYTLYSATPVDVTADVTSVNLRRGNDSQLFPDTTTGTCTINLNNDDACTLGPRTYDPQNSASPYFGNILPNRRVVVYCNDQQVFTGRVADWDFVYNVNGRSEAVMKCVDGLGILARQELDTFTATSAQAPGARISAVLDRSEVQWPYERSIDTGNSVLTGDTVSFGTNALEYLNTVNKSELGLLFCAKDGTLTFRDRFTAQQSASALTFADDGSGVPYSAVSTQYGSELLFNRVVVNNTGFSPSTSIDVTSQAEYGIATYSTPTLLLNSSTQMLDLASYLLNSYANPEYRVVSIQTPFMALSTADQLSVLSLDLASVVTVTFTPNGTGTPISLDATVIGIMHEIGHATHNVTLSLADLNRSSQFTLDSVLYGVLDSSQLAF